MILSQTEKVFDKEILVEEFNNELEFYKKICLGDQSLFIPNSREKITLSTFGGSVMAFKRCFGAFYEIFQNSTDLEDYKKRFLLTSVLTGEARK
ncbi:hypothetical protein AYI68_g2510 [Smittium mucronatum]|uniref:Uncharacterized protein n=1 Tax=Smittium mucronatum TaxID=133383 RepID=A0A1R0H2K5_9FUNG|nr:hypothetical protein AYI68_g2510 [Smittium mucronatum]